MRVLLIKTSSMGDILHTLPALSDAGLAIKNISFDWVIENAFAEIPTWHPLVNEVIPIALRRWRKDIFTKETRLGFGSLRKRLKQNQYDLILDAQGLVKSAFLSFLTKGERVGLNWRSARESLASLAYQRKCDVNFYQHAIFRMRSLFSQAFHYPLPQTLPHFGLDAASLKEETKENYLVFLHGTTWLSKEWPETYWAKLAKLASASGYRIKISGGNEREVERAKRIASYSDSIDVKPYLSIAEMARLLANAKGAVAVDTGFGHLAGALDVPTISLYGSTNSKFTGAIGAASSSLQADFSCSPCLRRTCNYREKKEVTPACYQSLNPDYVFEKLKALIEFKK